jgi:PAS domain S-box-containing protein
MEGEKATHGSRSKVSLETPLNFFSSATASIRFASRASVMSKIGKQMNNNKANIMAELIEEISGLNQRIRELEQAESERKRTVEALSSERNLMQTIIDSLPDRIYVKDLDKRFTLNNTAHITALGATSRADALGRTDHDFRIPELADSYAADDRDVMQSGCPLYNREEVTVLPSGEKGWLLVSKMPLRDTEGKIIGLVGISHDITERKRIEEEKDKLVSDLQKALSEVKTLRGFLPICSNCKKIRDDKGYWNQIESYIRDHSDAEFSHGICPECAKKLYPDMAFYGEDKSQQ